MRKQGLEIAFARHAVSASGAHFGTPELNQRR
jgi:hypothetical protein